MKKAKVKSRAVKLKLKTARIFLSGFRRRPVNSYFLTPI
jgi:hypothetical protein